MYIILAFHISRRNATSIRTGITKRINGFIKLHYAPLLNGRIASLHAKYEIFDLSGFWSNETNIHWILRGRFN